MQPTIHKGYCSRGISKCVRMLFAVDALFLSMQVAARGAVESQDRCATTEQSRRYSTQEGAHQLEQLLPGRRRQPG